MIVARKFAAPVVLGLLLWAGVVLAGAKVASAQVDCFEFVASDYSDGELAGWTTLFNGDLGKDESETDDYFVVLNGGSYVDWWNTVSLFDTPVSGASDGVIEATFVMGSGDDVGVWFGADADGSPRGVMLIFADGDWQTEHEGGYWGTGSGLDITVGVPFVVRVDNTVPGDTQVTVAGDPVDIGALSKSGLHFGVSLSGASRVDEIKIGGDCAGGGGPTTTAPPGSTLGPMSGTPGDVAADWFHTPDPIGGVASVFGGIVLLLTAVVWARRMARSTVVQ